MGNCYFGLGRDGQNLGPNPVGLMLSLLVDRRKTGRRVSGIGRLVAVGHSQSVGRITRESAADVFPTATVDADVLETDRRVGEDLKPATTSALQRVKSSPR